MKVKKKAEAHQRVEIAELEAAAIKGENESKAKIADYNAQLSERQVDPKRRGEVAMANAERDVLLAQKDEEIALLEKQQIAQQVVERTKVEIEAEAEAERLRRIAGGEADAVLKRYTAEAEGTRKLLEAKAEGYKLLLAVCEDRKDLASALLIIEQLPELIREQFKPIQNLQIDKITVWDSGDSNGNGDSTTAGFLKGMIGALSPVHELARQAGIELPDILGKVANIEASEPVPSAPAATTVTEGKEIDLPEA